MSTPHFTLKVATRFNAARALRHYTSKCANIHGHDFKVEAEIGIPDPSTQIGLVLDFYEVQEWMEKTAALIDHQFINEIPPFDEVNPTTENIAKWFYHELNKKIEKTATLFAITLWENETFSVRYGK